jgi:hypothetical protein
MVHIRSLISAIERAMVHAPGLDGRAVMGNFRNIKLARGVKSAGRYGFA